MNDDKLIAEYKKTWEQVTLADSARLRIEESLRAQIRSEAVATPTAKPSPYTRFFTFSYAPVAAFAIMLLVGVGTWQAEPESGLYTFKERIGRAFGIEQFYPTRLAELPETTIESAPLPAEESAQEETRIAFVPPPAPEQMTNEAAGSGDGTLSMRAMPKEEEAVMDIAATMMVADGLMDIEQYRSDVVFKEKTYRELVKKYEADIEEKTREGFIKKLDTVKESLAETETSPEEAVRQSLDAASVLLGEIESELSLLGQVEIENGTIISIDFSKQPE